VTHQINDMSPPPRRKAIPKQPKKTTTIIDSPVVALLSAPVRGKDYEEIEVILKSRVKEQDGAMRTISDNLYAVLTTPVSFAGAGKPRIYKMLFAGTSGCGKTETAHTIRHILGMEPGYEYQNQYVDIDGSTINNETQMNAQLGASPGLVGYGDKNTLAHRLNRALRLCGGEEDDVRRPEYIMLFIDEIDKAHPDFLVVLNGVLDRGIFEAACGERFVLPLETIMLVIFTANYGEMGIANMKYRYAPQGEQFVKQAMKEGRLQENTIERMGRIVIFYPLGGAVLKKILMSRLEHYIRESEISKQYGENRIVYQDDVKDFLIDKVVAATDSGKGVRSGLRGLFENVHVFFQKALCQLNKMVSKEELANLKPDDKIVISKREIDHKHFVNFEESVERECELFMRNIVQSLLEDPHCRELIPAYTERKEPIDAMSVHFAGRHIVSSCFGSGVVMIQQNNLYQNCTFATVPEDYTHLKQNMDKLDELVKNSSPNDPHFYSKVKKIAKKSRHLGLEQEDKSDHSVRAIRDCTTGTTTTISTKSSSSATVSESDSYDMLTAEESSSAQEEEEVKEVRRHRIPRSERFSKKEMVAMFGDEYEVNMPSEETSEEEEHPRKRRKIISQSIIVDTEPTHRKCIRCYELLPAKKFINYVRHDVPHYRSYCNRAACKKK
jgi:DNA polymerase III delta prime subunit